MGQWQTQRDELGDAAAPVIWDSEAVGNACEGLKRRTSNKAWYELASINNSARLETTNKTVRS
ncbi:Lactoylglutathione lyase, partial [Clarias magur]